MAVNLQQKRGAAGDWLVRIALRYGNHYVVRMDEAESVTLLWVAPRTRLLPAVLEWMTAMPICRRIRKRLRELFGQKGTRTTTTCVIDGPDVTEAATLSQRGQENILYVSIIG